MIEFLSQGGYAFYVWMSYGACAVLMVAEVLILRRQRRTILSRVSRLVRMRSEERHESQA